jgi:pyrroloquinoline quinone (PQQ) biosynthesis protein C
MRERWACRSVAFRNELKALRRPYSSPGRNQIKGNSDFPSSASDMTNFFVELVTTTDEARRNFENHPVALDAVASGLSVERYRRLLLELYQVVWHFNPICAAAASRLQDEHKQVRHFLYDHMKEESGHEEWVRNDLLAIGVSALTLEAHQPTHSTLAMVGYNSWSADRRHPCAVLGMMYALEVIASVYGGLLATAVRDSLLLASDQGTSFLSSHASLDTKHMLDLRLILNTVEERSARAAIVESTNINFELVTRIFAAI